MLCLLSVLAAPPAVGQVSSAESDYAERKKMLLESCSSGPDTDAFDALAKLGAGKALCPEAFSGSFRKISAREDCADFVVHGVLRLLYQFSDSPLVAPGLLDTAKRTVLDFKYWPDEPGTDSMCTWSENHHILFSSAGYLAGQLYPGETFSNSGKTGRELMEVHRRRVMRWLDLRFRTGLNEWLSNVYYEEDTGALLSLIDFSKDEEIVTRGTMMFDLLLTDIALNSYRGLFGSTHGRSYEGQKKWADRESTRGIYALALSRSPEVGSRGGIGSISMALSPKYTPPDVLQEIANDSERSETINRQRVGIRLAEAGRWGLKFDNFEDGMVLLSMEAYGHPFVIDLMADMLDAFHWWDNKFFKDFARLKGPIQFMRRAGLLPLLSVAFERDVTRNFREEVNIYTYRTPDYMLSCAQDYRKGYGGDQQHIWQASLGPDAVCFTTQPARRGSGSLTPNYWAGSGILPRAAQVKNVLFAIYDIHPIPTLYVKNEFIMTHAWFPKDKFDEVIEQAPWIFARKGDGYLALCSQNPWTWQTEPGDDQNREMIVNGRKNIWICELGRKTTDGTFEEFRDRIARAPLSFNGLNVQYTSPSQGQLCFGLDGPLTQNGQPVSLGNYPRYDNPYIHVDFPADVAEISCGNSSLKLDWINCTREVVPR